MADRRLLLCSILAFTFGKRVIFLNLLYLVLSFSLLYIFVIIIVRIIKVGIELDLTGLIISLNRSGARFRVCVHGRVGLSGQQPHKRGSSLSYHRDTPRRVHRNHASLVIRLKILLGIFTRAFNFNPSTIPRFIL